MSLLAFLCLLSFLSPSFHLFVRHLLSFLPSLYTSIFYSLCPSFYLCPRSTLFSVFYPYFLFYSLGPFLSPYTFLSFLVSSLISSLCGVPGSKPVEWKCQ
ncbi:hypothetical protein XENOCAPTIV_022352 [Xenoophorus captivus]|uniref:Uncharacterized protein n=1 Tax=Xenoophorus captivus TaxID=1517983 RepID=A0ABV0QTY0_9TELE